MDLEINIGKLSSSKLSAAASRQGPRSNKSKQSSNFDLGIKSGPFVSNNYTPREP